MTDSGGDVFVVGAGFSRAISNAMPLTDELGTECLKQLDTIDRANLPTEFTGGSFEPFMSMLAVDQPYLTDSENLRNRRLFVELSAAIAETLAARQFDTLTQQVPRWLEDLVSTWHHTDATVITFNYDTLIEAVTHPAAGLLNKHGTPSPDTEFPWSALINNQPPEPPGLIHIHDPAFRTFRLLKLHGSTNWYWQPNDPTGITAARRHPAGAFEMPGYYDPVETARWWPGRVPMIIPPTASKADYYRTPLLREIWLQARKRLDVARRVHVVGYSLPPTDLSTRELLKTAVGSNTAEMVVADPNGHDVAARLVGLGIDSDRISTVHSSVETMANALVRERSSSVLKGLQALAANDPDAVVAVHWGNKAYAVATAVTRMGSDLVLTVDPPNRDIASACRSRSDGEVPGLTLRELADAGPAEVVRADAGDDSAYIVADVPYAQTWGHALHWRLLTASRTFTQPADGQAPEPSGTFTLSTSDW